MLDPALDSRETDATVFAAIGTAVGRAVAVGVREGELRRDRRAACRARRREQIAVRRLGLLRRGAPRRTSQTFFERPRREAARRPAQPRADAREHRALHRLATRRSRACGSSEAVLGAGPVGVPLPRRRERLRREGRRDGPGYAFAAPAFAIDFSSSSISVSRLLHRRGGADALEEDEAVGRLDDRAEEPPAGLLALRLHHRAARARGRCPRRRCGGP